MPHEGNLEFTGSNSWLIGFKNRQHLHNINCTRESAISDALGAEQVPGISEENIEHGGYSSKHMLNTDAWENIS
jgi:hypothetical protein